MKYIIIIASAVLLMSCQKDTDCMIEPGTTVSELQAKINIEPICIE